MSYGLTRNIDRSSCQLQDDCRPQLRQWHADLSPQWDAERLGRLHFVKPQGSAQFVEYIMEILLFLRIGGPFLVCLHNKSHIIFGKYYGP